MHFVTKKNVTNGTIKQGSLLFIRLDLAHFKEKGKPARQLHVRCFAGDESNPLLRSPASGDVDAAEGNLARVWDRESEVR